MISKTKNRYHAVDVSMFVLTVLVTAITAIFLILYCHLFDELGLMAKKRLIEHPATTFLITPVFFWISAYLCRLYSPKAAGNHLYSALTELERNPNNFEKTSDLLNIRLVMTKAVSSLIANLGGGALGKEGPSVHMSAGIFATLSNRYKEYLPKINLETWVTAGTSAGLAIAFNAPIAGIVFAAERLSKAKFKNFFSNINWTLIIIAIITIIFHRPTPLFSFHNIAFRINSESFLLILIALTCGILAFLFRSTATFLYQKVSEINSFYWHLIPISAGIIVAYINFFCGIHSFSGGIKTAQEALSSSYSILSLQEVLGRILNTIITFASGCAGGLIAPAMAIGTGIGSIVGTLSPYDDIGIFLLIGMVSFLSAVLGEPITAAIVIYETTGQDVENIPFLLAAAVFSLIIFKAAGRIKVKSKNKI